MRLFIEHNIHILLLAVDVYEETSYEDGSVMKEEFKRVRKDTEVGAICLNLYNW